MKRLILLVAFLAVGCDRDRSPVTSSTSIDPPAGMALVPIPDLKGLEEKFTKTNEQLLVVSNQLAAVNVQLANQPAESAKAKTQILAETAILIRDATSPLATKAALIEMEQKLAAHNKQEEQRFAELQAEQTNLNNRMTQVQGEVRSAQAEMLQRIEQLSAEILKDKDRSLQASMDANLALRGITEMADKKSGGFKSIFGGGKEMIEDDRLQTLIVNRAAARDLPLSTREGIQIPNK